MSSPDAVPSSSRKRKSSPLPEPIGKGMSEPSLCDPQTIVTVHVKEPKRGIRKSFPVYKSFICYYSPFFDAAFNSTFIEGQTEKLELDNTPIDVFGLFVNWLYTQTIKDNNGRSSHVLTLCYLWILGDRILFPRLQNQTILALHAVVVERLKDKGSPSSALQCVYDNTKQNSPLRRYFVYLYARIKTKPIGQADMYPNEMLLDLVNEYRNLKLLKTPVTEKWNPTADDLKALFFMAEDTESRNKRLRLGSSQLTDGQTGSGSEDDLLILPNWP